MERKQKQVIESYERVQAFVESHPLEGGASYGAPKDMLDGVVARIGGHGETQESGARRVRAALIRQRLLAKELRNVHLRPLAQVARAVLTREPEIDELLRSPSPHVPARLLALKAVSVRKLAAEHEQLLAMNGCGADFLARLDAAIAALRGTLVRRALNTGSRVGARKGLEHEIQRGREAVLMLDAIVRRHFARSPETLGAWRMARRVRVLGGGTPSVSSGAPQAGSPSLEAA